MRELSNEIEMQTCLKIGCDHSIRYNIVEQIWFSLFFWIILINKFNIYYVTFVLEKTPSPFIGKYCTILFGTYSLEFCLVQMGRSEEFQPLTFSFTKWREKIGGKKWRENIFARKILAISFTKKAFV